MFRSIITLMRGRAHEADEAFYDAHALPILKAAAPRLRAGGECGTEGFGPCDGAERSGNRAI